MELYAGVRRAVLVESMCAREASRLFGLHRDTVRKMLANVTLRGYTQKRLPRPPKLEPYIGIIDAILEADQRVPRKQRHTVKRIFERLRDECLTMVRHELRTRLTSIMGSATAIIDGGTDLDPAVVRQFVRIIGD